MRVRGVVIGVGCGSRGSGDPYDTLKHHQPLMPSSGFNTSISYRYGLGFI